jgi:diguanylate cyclase (GGDEF)-like protein
VLTAIGGAVYDWDIATDAIAWGANAAQVLGLPDIGALDTGRGFALAVEPGSGRSRGEVIAEAEAADAGSGVAYRTRYAVRTRVDEMLIVEDTGRWYADAVGRPAFAHGVIRVERPDADQAALGAGLRHRSAFLELIGADVAEAARARRSMTLMVAAIDDLGRLNDVLGYENADAVIQEVTNRIRGSLRRRDRLMAYAGNRFAVALAACTAEQAEAAAARLAASVEAAPISSGVGPISVRLRIGASVAPEHAAEAPGLLRRAEEALGRAKRAAGRPFALFDPLDARNAVQAGRGPSAVDAVEALNDRRVLFARQPVVDAQSRLPVFHEALVRVRSPEGRIIGAGDILPAVERSGFVPLIDARMLELATDHLQAHPGERLSINVSPFTIENSDWLGMLAGHLGARPGIESRLIIEITETAAVRDPQATRARLDAMKALGVAIAIDDFGAGHTSFKHLRSFPVDILKIDGAFVQNLARSPDDRFFVRTLIDLAHHLGIATVAEWVEDEETACLLAEWGIDYLQGDHCGVPRLVGDADHPAPGARVA